MTTDTNTNAKPKRAVIYARCSTRDQDVENQLEQLRKYAAGQGWTVTEEVIDVCSGSKGDREGLTRLNDLVHRREMDVVLFWALDRFSREGSRKTIERLAVLDDARIDWHSYSEPFISSLGIFKDAIVAILGALAKQERVRISERTKAGLDRVRGNGQKLGRPVRDEATVNRARKLWNGGNGMSYSRIAKELGVTKAWAWKLVNGVREGKKENKA